MFVLYQILHNLNSQFLRSGTVEDHYYRGWGSDVATDDGDTDQMILDRIFSRHNADNRPDRWDYPALSVGDVIMLKRADTAELGDESVESVWTVADLGFKRLGSIPQNVTGKGGPTTINAAWPYESLQQLKS